MSFAVHAYQHISPFFIYLLVVAFLLLESSGIPIVNTTLLLFTGALAALGKLNLTVLVIVAVCGSTLGACLAYVLGKYYGESLLLSLGTFLRMDARKLIMTRVWFRQAGRRTVFFSRLVPYIRPFACFPAGMAAMPFLSFFLPALGGSFVWCSTFLVIGWELGPRWSLAVHLIRFWTLPTLAALLILLILSFSVRRALTRYVKRRLQVDEEETVPEHDLLEV